MQWCLHHTANWRRPRTDPPAMARRIGIDLGF